MSASNDFNEKFPPKLLRKLAYQIAINAKPFGQFTWERPRFVVDGMIREEQNFVREARRFQKQYQRLMHDDGSREDWQEFDRRIKQHMERYKDQINELMQLLYYDFADKLIEEDLIVSTRNRIERERKQRDNPDDETLDWQEISLPAYAFLFLKWFVNSWNDNLAKWDWSHEDWDSDIAYAMRGFFLVRNKHDGSGYDIFGVKTIDEAKALAESHIPREGVDIVINALDAIGYDRATLPKPWNGVAELSTHIWSDIDFDVLEINDQYAIFQVKNMGAAIALGYGTSWCTAKTNLEDNYFDDYADNLLIVCDNEGRRYQIHLPSHQFHNEADNQVDIAGLFDEFDQLFPILLKTGHYRPFNDGDDQTFIDICYDRIGCFLEHKNAEKLHNFFESVCLFAVPYLKTDILRYIEENNLLDNILDCLKQDGYSTDHIDVLSDLLDDNAVQNDDRQIPKLPVQFVNRAL